MDFLNILFAVLALGVLGIVLGAAISLSPSAEDARRDAPSSPKEEARDTVALVRCSGGVRAVKRFEYKGMRDCYAAKAVAGGLNECRSGCLGMGTCVSACPHGAISVTENMVAQVDAEKCTGCMICADVCPQELIVPIPRGANVHVLCSSSECRAALRMVCSIGCIGCGECAKACKYDAIHVVDDLAVMDHSRCVGCGECAAVCPRGVIADSAAQEADTEI